MKFSYFQKSALLILAISIWGCKNGNNQEEKVEAPEASTDTLPEFASEPLVKDNYTADPSAHVFEGKIYEIGRAHV